MTRRAPVPARWSTADPALAASCCRRAGGDRHDAYPGARCGGTPPVLLCSGSTNASGSAGPPGEGNGLIVDRRAGRGGRYGDGGAIGTLGPMDKPTLRWLDGAGVAGGVRTRPFEVGDGETTERVVPGLLWTPVDARGGRPLVLIGHGASGSKAEGYVVSVARWLVTRAGYAAAAIDGPVHGDRRAGGATSGAVPFLEFSQVWSGDPTMTDTMIADWRRTLDALSPLEEVDGGPVGWWGLSMGTILGLPFVAEEPRVQAAVLGLMGMTGPTRERIRTDAPRVLCPVLYLVQWDDELFDRHASFELFDALGSRDKRLHANPGRHGEVPDEEFEASVAFLVERLGGPVDPAALHEGRATA